MPGCRRGTSRRPTAALGRAGSYRSENPLEPEPSPYVGGASCVACHREESTQPRDRAVMLGRFIMARGLLDLPFPERPLADPDDPKVTHAIMRENDKIKVETHAGDKVYRLIVEYAFGIERPVRDDDRPGRRTKLSSFEAVVVSHGGGGCLGTARPVTCRPNSGENIRGEPIHVRDGVVRCLYCHVTFYRDFRDPPPETVEPGGCRPRDRLRAMPRARRQPREGDQWQLRGNRHREPRGGGCVRRSAKLCADCHIVGSAGGDQEVRLTTRDSSARRGLH